ncbi:hypothetical protein EDF64_10792 [Curtobacterium flaccumfaciens]|uniref:Uncharacterized protein n=1 Tax=Curtobacterium flaccumfaciens TaxID=2035 RepID=A0A4R6DH80_9MICO|nr:hypothetical protein EDF64_10792 [Curtobacterium flaccumfaciens]
MVAGCAIVVFAVRALLRDPSDDAAWVAVVLGVLFVAWGIAFDRLPDDDDDDDHDHDHHDDDHDQDNHDRRRVTGVLSTAMAATGAYVVIRAIGRPVDSALVGALTWPAWRLVNRFVDGVVRRREARGEADGATD